MFLKLTAGHSGDPRTSEAESSKDQGHPQIPSESEGPHLGSCGSRQTLHSVSNTAHTEGAPV